MALPPRTAETAAAGATALVTRIPELPSKFSCLFQLSSRMVSLMSLCRSSFISYLRRLFDVFLKPTKTTTLF
ncbi:hypothetical protein OWV82_021039 [Melia azedarach]|uniref:Uncharacterized protein n=1 Tax=Melia azedarach TaxID=155640 RepID=A0ACC1X979_MELAZ|nr:hypothetical protein OWV82_021039 [Melia azedarach]